LICCLGVLSLGGLRVLLSYYKKDSWLYFPHFNSPNQLEIIDHKK
jgi:hypothetical protein